jgi:biopolymer transport protein ExbB
MSLSLIDVVSNLTLAADAPTMSFDLVHMWGTMGVFAKFIAAVLGIMSIYSLGVMAERLVTYARAGSASRQFAEQLRALLPARKYAEAVALSRKLKRGHLCRVLGLSIEEYDRGMRALHSTGPQDVGDFDIIAAVNRAVDRSSMRTVADLRRGLGALATVGSTAMAASGSGGLGTVSAGIAEALVTTAFGLLVAIPAVMMFNYLTNRVEEMEVDINDSANELVDYFMKEGHGSEPAAIAK